MIEKEKYIMSLLFKNIRAIASGLLLVGVLSAVPALTFAASPFVSANGTSGSSYNWAGYVSSGGTYTSITGSWIIPTVSPATTYTAMDATWVGIGGVNSTDLIQAGTQAEADPNGSIVYQAWVETLPQISQQVALTVNAGDAMTVSLTQASAGLWNVSLQDKTSGQSYQTSVSYTSSLSSAEWIEEMPSLATSFVPLDNFGTVQFTGGSTTINGTPETISQANASELTMISTTGQTLATPSALGVDGSSFSVLRSSATYTQTPQSFPFGYGRRHRVGVRINGYTPPSQISTPSTAPTSTVTPTTAVTTVITPQGVQYQITPQQFIKLYFPGLGSFFTWIIPQNSTM